MDLVRFESLMPSGMQSNLEVLGRGLPKWPQMRVEGVSVTEDQAKEIIRRTDRFFSGPEYSGNDTAYIHRAMKLLKIPFLRNGESYELFEAWLKQWEFVETNYVKNSWISSSFIYGGHGWCHPDGTISYIDNVGKWPSCNDVYEDWKRLAAEFPFVHLIAILMDREECEADAQPVCGFYVKTGNVIVFDPLEHITNVDVVRRSRNLEVDILDSPMCSLDAEHSIPWLWIEDWAKENKFSSALLTSNDSVV